MSFLQTAMLWGLLAAALPILIHLLNRLRYRTVKWGAMMFLLKVSRSATRNSRLRHYLILAFRTLAVTAIALAMARPLLGGWLGAGLAGAPDTIMILLDRSASMERVDPRRQTSRREHGLALLAGMPQELSRGSHVVLLESALREPREIGSLAALPGLSLAAATDTAADWPAMFEAALDWLARTKPGRTEFWIVTDAQESNWQPGRGVWPDLAARLAAWVPHIRIRVMPVGGEPPDGNRTLALREVRRLPGSGDVSLSLALTPSKPDPQPVPAAVTLDGVRKPMNLFATSFVNESTHLFPVGAAVTSGWGRVELPADTQPRDHTAYFVYGTPTAGTGWTSLPEGVTADRTRFALAPLPADAAKLQRWPLTGVPDLRAAAFVVWQGPAPEGPDALALESFLKKGGVVLAMPAEKNTAAAVLPVPAPPRGTTTSFAAVKEEKKSEPLWRWSSQEEADPSAAFRISRWEENAGPLAKTAMGERLPVGAMSCRRRVAPETPEAEAWFVVAQFSDGKPALASRRLGEGRIYALATLPLPAWSTFDDGRVWVPMLWRMRDEGARALSASRISECGLWKPGSPEEIWEPVGNDGPRDPRTEAGVYRLGDRWIALNRPSSEDEPDVLDGAAIKALLPGVSLSVANEQAGQQPLYTEASLSLLLLAALFLLGEAGLALLDFRRTTKVRDSIQGQAV